MPYFMYVSISEEDRIAIFTMDPDTGKLEPHGNVAVTGRPAPLAVDPGRRFLYVGRRGSLDISSYRIDQITGTLSMIGTSSLEGDPSYIATDRKGRYLLSAYYFQGKVGIHPIGDDGVATAPPVEWLDTDLGAHSIQTDPSNKFVFVPHIAKHYVTGKGPNAIFQFKYDENTGHLTPNSPPKVILKEAEGPRHICFHPSRDIIYSSNEQGCSVTAYNFDSSEGTLTAFQTISTLPNDYEGENSCSQIQISPSGKFLYAPNRGHDSIACFSVDGSTGRLTSIGQEPTEPHPRAFSLDPEENFLFAAGLHSGRLASYRINGKTGELEPLEIYTVGKGPMWVLIMGQR